MMPKWTDAQAEAIYEPSGQGNILVSAAAGSGKTAVLVERIANMILRDENPISIDELLIVTFTEAAAAEMKERIINRINQAYRDAVDNGNTTKSRYLKDQMHLTATADINTIDAFCLRVVKNNFHILGIDPNFNIMDNNEGEMLMDDTLSELFLSLYATEDAEEKERFLNLITIYASNRDDEGLKSIVRKIYNFMQSFPSPLEWLREKADMYSYDMSDSAWIQDIFIGQHKQYIIRRHESFWNDMTDEMLKIVKEEYKIDEIDDLENIKDAEQYWGKLWKNVCMCRKAVFALKAAKTWEDLHEFYKLYIAKKSFLGSAMNFIPAKKEASDDLWLQFYNEYDYMRNELREDCMQLPTQGKEDFNNYVHSEELKQSLEDVVWLVEKFCYLFEEKKNRKNEKSFSDVEHLAYRLFRENENIRSEYADRYIEILIDEYQDTNGLQDAIFTSISRDNKNMFMVGDLKQSIYRFRGGDPTIFKTKSREYSRQNGGKRIMLSQNFRSRREVLSSINSVFEAVMSDEVGDVEYTDSEALKRDEERECYIDNENLLHPSNREFGYNSELYRIAVMQDSEETEDDVTAECAEAACIADRIRSLVDGHFKVYDGDGKYHDIEYRDIVILMRSTRNGGEVMRDILESRSVPAFVQKEEYFERREIKLMLTLITLINNHMQDIPLVSVMRSPIGGFSENELALIKIAHKGSSFYKAVKSYKYGCNNLTDEEKRLQNKCRHFIGDLDRWRGYVKMKPIASLIWTLYEETGFYDFMGALEGGEEAQANLKLLYERAKRYEESGFKGIFNFIRYIERMENRSEDISGAKLVNENHNVVKIMTIHKSKGLEFPVVFLARTSKKMLSNRPGGENRILLHKDLGLGVDYYNYEDMYCKKLMFNKHIKTVNDKEHISEEMRLLYVAMTRAKEKLIVTFAQNYKDEETYLAHLDTVNNIYSGITGLSAFAAKAKSYSDWIIPSVQHKGKNWVTFDKKVSSLAYEKIEEVKKEDIIVENPDEMRDIIRQILEFRYSFPQSGTIPAKTSVTAIKEMEDSEHIRSDDPVFMTQKPKFMRSEKLGAQIGTAHHQVMAFIDIEKMRTISDDDYEDFVNSEISRISSDGQIDEDIVNDSEITELMCKNICGFFRSDMGKNVLNAKRVYREKPFEIEISACEYDCNLGEEYIDEKVVVQGIIDLYFEDSNGNIILVDYKTDLCKTIEEQMAVAERYRKQIELYEKAMQKILKKSVKDKYLYLFSAQNVVKLV